MWIKKQFSLPSILQGTQSEGTEASWECMGSLSGRSPEGSWEGQEKEATPATTGTGQRSVERQGGMGQVRE